jgi:hypothetical protein
VATFDPPRVRSQESPDRKVAGVCWELTKSWARFGSLHTWRASSRLTTESVSVQARPEPGTCGDSDGATRNRASSPAHRARTGYVSTGGR